MSSSFLARWLLGSLVDELASKILSRLLTIEIQGDLIMATVQELEAKLDAIDTAITEERSEVQGLLDGLRQQIQDLQDQIGSGQLVTQEQLDALAASADAIVERVRDISEPVA